MTQDNEQERKLGILKSVFMTLDDAAQEHALSVLRALRFGQEMNNLATKESTDEAK